MKRDPYALADRSWDVLVVGGGIHGACVAWDAVLRGLAVCLVEKSDFSSATSANTMKIVHGGLRYLQHGDYRRMRDSIRERRTLLTIAPHLVHPLPVVVPTYGHGRRGREILKAALVVNDLIGLDRNRGLVAGQHTPSGRTVSRRECLRLIPDLAAETLTGAGIFYDAQVHNSERLVLAFLQSAAKAGAAVANYVAIVGLERGGHREIRVLARDGLTGEHLSLRARVVVNATGPWVDEVLNLASSGARLGTSFARAFNVVTRRLFPDYTVALPTACGAGDLNACGHSGGRFLFVVPWREQSLVGTWYQAHGGGPGDLRVTEADVTALLRAVNRTCPALALTLEDVRLVHGGLLPITGTDAETGEPQLASHVRIVDHTTDGWPGLLSVVGVKYTTARVVAERVVDRVFEHLGRTAPPSLSSRIPLHGGDLGDEMRRVSACQGYARTVLVCNYGSALGEVLAHVGRTGPADRLAVLRAEVHHAIHCEMAQTLEDIAFRRTELATGGDPGPALLDACARTAATELSWSAERTRGELEKVRARFGVAR